VSNQASDVLLAEPGERVLVVADQVFVVAAVVLLVVVLVGFGVVLGAGS
jgi:hypothetical protein